MQRNHYLSPQDSKDGHLMPDKDIFLILLLSICPFEIGENYEQKQCFLLSLINYNISLVTGD